MGHLRAAGFEVKEQNVDALGPIKQRFGVPAALQSCHTAVVDPYVIEGHVPADLIQRLLRERPAVVGLAVPGMPVGSPGMEQGGQTHPYAVMAFDKAGKMTVYSPHR